MLEVDGPGEVLEVDGPGTGSEPGVKGFGLSVTTEGRKSCAVNTCGLYGYIPDFSHTHRQGHI